MRYVPRLDDTLVTEATRHTHPLWGQGRTQEAHTAHTFAQLAEAGPELLRYVGLVGDDGALLASLKRFSLPLRVGPAVVRAVGIGAVFTPEDGRGRGAASALLHAVLEEARDLGYGAAWLYSDIAPAYYARLGFVELPALDHRAPVTALPEAGALSLRRAAPGDLDRLVAWYDASWPDGYVRPARSRASLRFFRWRNRLAEWILSDGGKEVGYAVAQAEDPGRDLPDPCEPGTLRLDELSAPGLEEARVWATVRALAAHEGARTVASWLRPEVEVPGFTAVPRREAVPMVAALGDQPALAALLPHRAYLGSLEHF